MNLSIQTNHPHAEVVRAARASAGEYLSFRLAAEEYGIDILKVQEIRGFEEPTRIAGAPPGVRGVLNLRGAIVPIVDLRSRFGIEPRFDDITVTVVLNVGRRVVGVVVDSVSDVVALAGDQVKPAPEFGGAIDAQHITGLGSLGQGAQERLLILLDIDRLVGQIGPAADAVDLH
jgi:purine-binding chemotaxis protein CheW